MTVGRRIPGRSCRTFPGQGHYISGVAVLSFGSYAGDQGEALMAKRRKAMKRSPGVGTARRHARVRPLARKSGLSKGGVPPFKSFVAMETPAARKIDLIRAGVGARVVDDMVAYLEVPKAVIFALLHTPESTAHKLIKDNRTLDAAASERVVRVADITRMAEATFGGREAATHWLKIANLALGGATPLSMLDTEPGAAEVRRVGIVPPDRVLGRIELPDKHSAETPALAQLPRDWQRVPATPGSMDFGTTWAKALRSLVLYVPSALVPEEKNAVVNPAHREFAAVRMAIEREFRYDDRMYRTRRSPTVSQ